MTVHLGRGTRGAAPISTGATGTRPDDADPLRQALRVALGGEAGLDTWRRTAILYRLAAGLREEQPTLDILTARYHLPLQDIVNVVAAVSVRWHSARPLQRDSAWPASSAEWTAPALRGLQPALKAVGNALRDLHEPLGALYDEFLADEVAAGATPEHAAELLAGLITTSGLLRLTRDMTEEEIGRRMAGVTDWEWVLGPYADLFAPDVVEHLDGRTMIQAAVLAVRFFEWRILGTKGCLVTRRGRRSILHLEQEAGRELVAFLRDQTGHPLTGYAAALLVVACPSAALVGWRKAALRTIWKGLRPAQRVKLKDYPPDAVPRALLPPAAHALYVRLLGGRLALVSPLTPNRRNLNRTSAR